MESTVKNELYDRKEETVERKFEMEEIVEMQRQAAELQAFANNELRFSKITELFKELVLINANIDGTDNLDDIDVLIEKGTEILESIFKLQYSAQTLAKIRRLNYRGEDFCLFGYIPNENDKGRFGLKSAEQIESELTVSQIIYYTKANLRLENDMSADDMLRYIEYFSDVAVDIENERQEIESRLKSFYPEEFTFAYGIK